MERKKRHVFLFFFVFLSALLLYPAKAYSAERYSAQAISKYQKFGGEFVIKSSTPNPILEGMGGSTEIGFDSLYGTGQNSFAYLGEIPKGADKLTGGKDYSTNITLDRNWVKDPQSLTKNVNSKNNLSWEESGTSDLHAYGVSMSSAADIMSGISGFGESVAFSIISFFNGIAGFILKIILILTNMDLTFIVDAINGSGIGKAIGKMIIGENGSFSPLMVIATVLFIIGFVKLGFEYVRGQAAMKQVLETVFVGILAYGIAFGSISGGFGGVSKAATTLIQRATVGIVAGSGHSDNSLFTYKSNDPARDAWMTQYGLFNKLYIDNLAAGNYGDYKIEDLYLFGGEGYARKNWGISESEMKTLIKNINGDPNVFAVSNSKSGNNSNKDMPNLAYFTYATLSGTNTKKPFTTNGKNAVINADGSWQKVAYATDLLAAIDAKVGGSAKCQKIIENLWHPHHDVVGLALLFAQSIAMLGALGVPAAMEIFNKLIFCVGVLFIPFIPIFMLIPNKESKKIARQFFNTWIVAVMKALLSQVVIVTYLYFVVAIAEAAGTLGIVINIIVSFILTTNFPKLYRKINEIIQATPFDNQLRATRELGSWMDNKLLYNGNIPKAFGGGRRRLSPLSPVHAGSAPSGGGSGFVTKESANGGSGEETGEETTDKIRFSSRANDENLRGDSILNDSEALKAYAASKDLSVEDVKRDLSGRDENIKRLRASEDKRKEITRATRFFMRSLGADYLSRALMVNPFIRVSAVGVEKASMAYLRSYRNSSGMKKKILGAPIETRDKVVNSSKKVLAAGVGKIQEANPLSTKSAIRRQEKQKEEILEGIKSYSKVRVPPMKRSSERNRFETQKAPERPKPAENAFEKTMTKGAIEDMKKKKPDSPKASENRETPKSVQVKPIESPTREKKSFDESSQNSVNLNHKEPKKEKNEVKVEKPERRVSEETRREVSSTSNGQSKSEIPHDTPQGMKENRSGGGDESVS